MGKLILLRHGESCWNYRNLFTGWVDIPLSSKGIQEALDAGELIKDLPIDIIFTSTLVRAQMTAFLAMSKHHSGKVPIVLHEEGDRRENWGKTYNEDIKEQIIPILYVWELNERMYGELQGLNKAQTIEKFGAEQVKLWRRSFDIAPPGGESLEMTAARALPYFKTEIVPYLEEDRNVFICAHGNSLRAIRMELEKFSKADIVNLEIPTGVPMIYDYHQGIFSKNES